MGNETLKLACDRFYPRLFLRLRSQTVVFVVARAPSVNQRDCRTTEVAPS
jgi:hypothetical protein